MEAKRTDKRKRADQSGSRTADSRATGFGYKTFVAWRYLLVDDNKVTRRSKWILFGMAAVSAIMPAVRLQVGSPGIASWLWIAQWVCLGLIAVAAFFGVLRHSKVALIVCEVGLGLVALAFGGAKLVSLGELPLITLEPEQVVLVLQVLNIVAIIGGVLAALAMFFGCLRAFFTFFTTVPIGGVWIGTAALVAVLAVMSGFETDLREKILGSNAHLQITREDGEFTEWREIEAKIDRMPGVVASTPFAMSEVVVAASGQPFPVIIKGIDPKTVGKVTDLIADLKDRDAIDRLPPLVSDSHDLTVKPVPQTGPLIDKAPSDMPAAGAPIDYSKPQADSPIGSGSGTDGGEANLDAPEKVAPEKLTGEPYGGDAQKLFDRDRMKPFNDDEWLRHIKRSAQPPVPAAPGSAAPAVDPAPSNFASSDEPPPDYSQPGYQPETSIKVIDSPFDTPSMSRRTQSLPGILVGQEMFKQAHIYVGQEVHVVSPLSDPSNPDATGTPVPFNRDFRVSGRFFTGMYEYDLKYVYVTLDALQEFLDRGDVVDGIEIRIQNPEDTDAFVAQLQTMFGPHYLVQDWKELNRSLFSALKLEKIAMFLVLGIVILVASFAIIGILIMVVVEKQREIALLKTLGASDIGVMQVFAIQGLMIGFIGTILGVATGLAICWASKRFGLPLNPDVYYIDKMPIHIDPASVLASASAGVLISIAATVYPAVVAGRVRPAVGMRH